MVGDRGGVFVTVPCNELWEDRLCSTGVTVRSLVLRLVELGVLRMCLGNGLDEAEPC